MAVKPLPKTLKRKIRATTLIVLITLVIFFVAGEILTRLFKNESPPRVVASENQKLVYELNKNYKDINYFGMREDRKSTRLNSSHVAISYAVFCLKKKKKEIDSDTDY